MKKEIRIPKDKLDSIKTAKGEAKKLTKDKAFSKLTAKEKDSLLETLCKMFNLI